MTFSSFRNRVMRAAGATMSLFALCAPASAFPISDLSPAASAPRPDVAVYQYGVDKPKLEQVWCRWGGCGAPALVGGLAAGAIIGGALAAPYYGGPYYGGPYYGYGGPYYPGCWRSVWTYYGWRRAWVC